jgi:hypothetical protein
MKSILPKSSPAFLTAVFQRDSKALHFQKLLGEGAKNLVIIDQ